VGLVELEEGEREPTRLLRFPSFFSSRFSRPRIAAAISFVVVLPELPVTAITGIGTGRARIGPDRPGP